VARHGFNKNQSVLFCVMHHNIWHFPVFLYFNTQQCQGV
jgi:hypothetical protein